LALVLLALVASSRKACSIGRTWGPGSGTCLHVLPHSHGGYCAPDLHAKSCHGIKDTRGGHLVYGSDQYAHPQGTCAEQMH
jgi:hypothetical protein